MRVRELSKGIEATVHVLEDEDAVVSLFIAKFRTEFGGKMPALRRRELYYFKIGEFCDCPQSLAQSMGICGEWSDNPLVVSKQS